jgi:DMSO/TMAO reductase YedYZ molybdopterin-dependent catalytic subunit
VGVVSRGFAGRRRDRGAGLPPGQYLTEDFPVLSAGPTPRVSPADWSFRVVTETGAEHRWDWAALQALPSESITVDLHCVTRWSKLATAWDGVSVDALMSDVQTAAAYAMVHSYDDYTTNLPVADLLNGQAWLAYRYDGADLPAVHGGPVRLLVPHLYLWKSAKWLRGFSLGPVDEPGFWESAGYHHYGDPWREQRYWGD